MKILTTNGVNFILMCFLCPNSRAISLIEVVSMSKVLQEVFLSWNNINHSEDCIKLITEISNALEIIND